MYISLSSFNGIVLMVLALLVISSPVTPSPLVEAVINLPFSYLRETLKPSILYSHTYFGIISSFFILLSNVLISSSLNTLLSESMGILCVTLLNSSKTAPPALL